jgi:hypothetical protein
MVGVKIALANPERLSKGPLSPVFLGLDFENL